MGLTNFPNGITSFGVPLPGAGAFGMATSSSIWFVDKVAGNDGNTGKAPDDAFATLEKAISVLSHQDVIYIAPGGAISSGDPVAYVTANAANHVILDEHYGVAVVGITHAGMRGFPMDPQIKGGATSETAGVITCYAPYCAFENLAFNRGSAVYGLRFKSDSGSSGATQANANNISVYNCYFRNVRGSGATGDTGGAIYIEGGMGFNINHCMFYNCRQGIAAKSGTDVCENLFIDDCTFMASAASNISVDIYMYFQGQNYSSIRDIQICHDVPSYSGGHGACIVGTTGVIGMISRVYALDADGTVHASTGTIVRVPTTMGTADVWCGDQTNPAAN